MSYTVGDRVLFGDVECTVEAIGVRYGTRWTMAIADDKTVLLGQREDFRSVKP